MAVFYKLFLAHRRYFIVLFSFISAALLFLFANSKAACFLLLNSIHYKWLDCFFIVITFMGDGIFSIAIALLLLPMRAWQLAYRVIISFLMSSVFAQLIKTFIPAPRPKNFFVDGVYKFFLPGITHGGWSSFPSGHTTSVFALVTVLVLQLNKKYASMLLLSTALLVGYSRIYLGQHFLEDVTAGAILGTFTGIGVHVFADIYRFRSRFRKPVQYDPSPDEPSFQSTFAGNQLQ